MILALSLGRAVAAPMTPGPLGIELAPPPLGNADEAFTDNGTPSLREVENTALADAVRENEAFQTVMHDMTPLFQPLTPDTGFDPNALMQAPFASAQDQGKTKLAQNAQGAVAPASFTIDPQSVTQFGDDGRVTLRQVLQAIEPPAVERGRETQRRRSAAELEDADMPQLGISLPDLTNMLLDSRLVGETLRQVIGVDSISGTFSVFGMGDFQLNRDPSTDTLTLSDTQSNLSLTMHVAASDDLDDAPMVAPGAAQQHRENINLWAVALGYLESSTGIMMMICAGTLLLVWAAARVAIRR